MATIKAEMPGQLYKEAESLVKEGWFRNKEDIFSEAIRRFFETHPSELMERFVREGVEWDLHGND